MQPRLYNFDSLRQNTKYGPYILCQQNTIFLILNALIQKHYKEKQKNVASLLDKKIHNYKFVTQILP